jgi:tetratricopeptide (TPR) repeat protein/O-antigen ligase
MGTLERWCQGALEASWLAAAVLIPLFVDKSGGLVFEGAKVGLLHAIALLALAAWLAKGLAVSRATELARTPLVAPVALGLLAALLACALSLSPHASFWGARGSASGVVTWLAELVLFAAVATHLRTEAQLRRLLDALLLPSVPIVLYALAQRAGYEPLHISVRDTDAERVTSLLGQPVYLGAYLGFVVPFTVMRAVAGLRAGARSSAGAYAGLAALQLLALLFTESRGPMLAVLAAGALVVLASCARRGLRKPVIALWVFAAVAGLAVVLARPESSAPSSRTARRAEDTFAVQSGSGGLFRAANWRVAERVLKNRAPVELTNGEHDPTPWLRPLVGYGPEVSPLVAAPFLDDAIPQQLGYFLVAHFHNQLWDVLLTTGALGLTAQLAVQLALLRLLLRTLGLLTRERTFWLLSAGAGVAGGLGWTALHGFGFFFLGLQLGLLAGVAAYLSWRTFTRPEQTLPARADEGVLLAILAATSAHLVEVSFSFATVTTALCFWLLAAVALASARGIAPTPARMRTANEDFTGALGAACMLDWVGLALAFTFLGAASMPTRASDVLRDGFTLLAQPAGVRAPAVVLIVLATLLFGALLLRQKLAWTLGLASVFSLALSMRFAALLARHASARELADKLSERTELVTTFYVAALLLWGLLALALRSPRQGAAPRPARAVLAGALVVAAVALAAHVTVRPARAEAALALAEAYKANSRFAQAEQAYREAIERAPESDFYHAALAKSLTRQSRAKPSAVLLQRAERLFREAIARAPTEPEHATNLALVVGQRALMLDPKHRGALQEEAASSYARALRLSPYDPTLRRAFTNAQLNLFADLQGAMVSARRALELEPKSAASYAVMGDAQLVFARTVPEERRARMFQDAAENYQHAHALEPRQSLYEVAAGRAYLQAGQHDKAAQILREALRELPAAARDRASVVALLERAEAGH